MPAQTPHQHAPPATDAAATELRHGFLSDWPDLHWPINEILLESLVLSGRSDAQIALMCGVEADAVRGLRRSYGL